MADIHTSIHPCAQRPLTGSSLTCTYKLYMQNVHPGTINYGPSVTVYYKQFMTNNCAVVGEPLVPLNREVPVAVGAGGTLDTPQRPRVRTVFGLSLYSLRRSVPLPETNY